MAYGKEAERRPAVTQDRPRMPQLLEAERLLLQVRLAGELLQQEARAQTRPQLSVAREDVEAVVVAVCS